MKDFMSAIVGIIKIFFSHPRLILKEISLTNFKTLIEAVRKEPLDNILDNVFLKIGKADRVTNKPIVREIAAPLVTKDISVDEKIEQPQEKFIFHVDQKAYYSNMLILQGWAFKTPIPLKKIVAKINGETTDAVIYGFERKDVQAIYEDPFSLKSGFFLQFYIDSFASLDSIELVFIDFMGVEFIEKLNPPFKESIPKSVAYNINQVYRLRLQESYKLNAAEQDKNIINGPLISLVVPVYNIDVKWMKLAVDSIVNQTYQNWELVLVDDCSTKTSLIKYLKSLSNSKIKVIFSSANGRISKATNIGIAASSGDYIAFMDHDDKLAPDAFEEIAKAINDDKSIDLIYTDEDKINTSEVRFSPIYKTDWSPQLVLTTNYFNHLLCIRAELVKKESFRSEFDGCQDWDFILRVLNHVEKIHHIPKVLYHWRTLEGSIAGEGGSKEDNFSFFEKCNRVINNHLKQISPHLSAHRPEFAVDKEAALFQLNWTEYLSKSISFVISVTDFRFGELILQKLNSLFEFNVECVIICESHLFERLTEFANSLDRIDLKQIDSNQSQKSLCRNSHIAIAESEKEVLIFLDEKIHNLSEQWLRNIVGALYLDDIGSVTSKVLDEENNIFSTGIICGLFTEQFEFDPVSAFKGTSNQHIGYFFFSHIIRNYSSLPPYVFAIRKDIYSEFDGFSDYFNNAYFIEDFSLRLTKSGKYNVCLPDHVSIFNDEDVQGQLFNFSDYTNFINKHKNYVDPFYNENLSRFNLFEIDPLISIPDKLKGQEDRILFCTHNLNLEGAPIQLFEIVKGLIEQKGYKRIDVFSPLDGELKKWYEEIGVTVVINSDFTVFGKDFNNSQYNKKIKLISKWLEVSGYNLVVSNTLVTFYMLHAARIATLKTMWVIHESAPITELIPKINYDINSRIGELLRSVNRVVFTTKTTLDLYGGFKQSNNYSTINLGISTEKIDDFIEKNDKFKLRSIEGIDPDKTVFLSVGTFTERKGQLDFVLSAINHIKKGNYNSVFILVGASGKTVSLDYEDKIRRLIKENSVQTYFKIINQQPDIYKYYMMSDVYVCSSYNESYPRVTLLAMRFSLPVISTPVFGLADQMKSGVNVIYYSPSNHAELEDRILYFINNKDRVREMGDNSTKVLSLINSYEEMLEKFHYEIDSLI